MFAAAPVKKALVALASFYLWAHPMQTRPIDTASSSETFKSQGFSCAIDSEKGSEKGTGPLARGTSPPLVGSHGCVRSHYIRFGIVVATSREGGWKWELLESNFSFFVCFFFFFLFFAGEAVICSSSSLFWSLVGRGLKVGYDCCQI